MIVDRMIDRAASRDWEQALSLLVPLAAVWCLVCTIIWAGTGFGYWWPGWIVFAALVPISLMKLLPAMLEGCEGPRRRLAAHAALAFWVAGILFMIWLLSGAGAYWPFVTTVLLAASIAVHELWIRSREQRSGADPELEQRVEDLTRTRRGALDVQAEELRRIERDLHDGAQARLVALTMQLGRAEERLADRPEDRELVRAARQEAGAAISELRDLARGIAPPVLADRGLLAAIEALGSRSAVPVEVRGQAEGDRPAPAIEAVAYFVAAESLTNVAKHAGGPAVVEIDRRNGMLELSVSDQGPGGADPAGSGLSGLRSRVEAVDGALVVVSPPGGGTRVTAELPCE